MVHRKQRLTKQERRQITTARRQTRSVGTHETEKYLTAIRKQRETGVTMKAGDWA